ncbi:DUF262 domain-containing protein [Methylorubrum populi]
MSLNHKALADRLFPSAQKSDELELRDIPPEQRRLHTETSDLTVSSLYGYMSNGKIEIPEFQRGYVWNRTQASRLIESLIIQCPIPVVYFSQSHDYKLIVIDGNQRLLSIKLFMDDGYELQGLTTYPELNDLNWSNLDPRFRDHILNRTIRCITILKDTHPQIKFDVFERLNTGSVKLNAQELRHGINHGPLMRELDELTRNETWKRLTGIKRDNRMRGAELVLRFFAFRYARDEYAKPLSVFLDQFTSSNRNTPERQIDQWADDFAATLSLVDFALGSLAFRIYDENLRPNTSFNSALYDAQMVAFSETTNALIHRKNFEPERLQRSAARLFASERFENSIGRATSDEQSVKTRIEMYLSFLNEFTDAV